MNVSAWFLRGKSKEIARIEWKYDGLERVSKLLELEYSGNELKRRLIDAELKADLIDGYEADLRLANIDYTGDELVKKLLDIEMKHNKITEIQYNKERATLNNEAWVHMVTFEIDKNNPTAGVQVELDWNQKFIDDLIRAGYTGGSELS